MPLDEEPVYETKTVIFRRIYTVKISRNTMGETSSTQPTGSNKTAHEHAEVGNVSLSHPKGSLTSAHGDRKASATSAYDNISFELPLPVCKLPYFHGSEEMENLAHQLRVDGDFLLFLDRSAGNAPTLLIRDDAHTVHRVAVCSDEGMDYCHYYFVEGDLEFRFNSIGCLIKHYENRLLALGASKKMVVRRGIKCSDYDGHLSLEMNPDLTTWGYRLPRKTPVGRFRELLTQNGDYIITADQPDQHTLFVRWHDNILTMLLTPNRRGHWILPRLESYEPEETVKTLDCWIKSMARIRHVFHDFCLVKPVRIKSKRRLTKNFAVGHFADDYSTPAPRPIHALPFYYGRICEHNALKHLRNNGDYLVFVNKKDGCPYLASCLLKRNEAFYRLHKIRTTEDGFYMFSDRDSEKKFGTIDELLRHYETNHLPLKTETDELSGRIAQPVGNEQLSRELLALRNYDDSRLCHGYIRNSKADKLLASSGDFLVRQAKSNGDYMLTVRWGDRCYDAIFEFDKPGLYALARNDDVEPIEYVTDFWDFLKAVVIGANQIDHIVLKRLVPRRRI